MMFIDVYCGEPGSLHDARVFRKSPLHRQCDVDVGSMFEDGKQLLGDNAYPRLLWLVTPHRNNGHLTAAQRDFNYRHSKTRITVEKTFGLLKGRFRKLFKVEMSDTPEIPRVTVACCVLHNICLLNGDDVSDMFAVDPYMEDSDIEE